MSKVVPPPELLVDLLSTTFAMCDENEVDAALKGLLALVYGVATIATGLCTATQPPVPRARINQMLDEAFGVVERPNPDCLPETPEHARTMGKAIFEDAILQARTMRTMREDMTKPQIIAPEGVI